jgi:cell division protein FtsB
MNILFGILKLIVHYIAYNIQGFNIFNLQSLEDQLAKLTADFEQATAEKMKCQQEADATNAIIALANRLVGGLASENIRWADSVAKYCTLDVYHFINIYHGTT